MIVLRWFAFLVFAFCLAWSVTTWTISGATLLGLIAWVGFLATFGVFTRAFWIEDLPVASSKDVAR